MINLSPYELKKQIKAARANSSLVKYLILLLFASLFLAAICTVFYFILDNSRPIPISTTSATNSTKTVETTDLNGYNQARVQATKINNDFQTAENILNEQISYSAILSEIANILPSGTIINKLDLNSSSLNSLSLKIYSKTADNSSIIKQNIEKSTIFTNYNLSSVKTEPTNPSGYPTTIEITVGINKGAVK